MSNADCPDGRLLWPTRLMLALAATVSLELSLSPCQQREVFGRRSILLVVRDWVFLKKTIFPPPFSKTFNHN